jgi:hypothetical protein
MCETNRTAGPALTRRTLARTLGGAAAAACLPSLPSAAETPPPARRVADPLLDAAIASAFAATPAALSPEQRLDVRNGVRNLQQVLVDARGATLGYETEPATIFRAKPVRE